MRLEDWWERLEQVIAKHDTAPFEWGVSDCAQLTFDAIEALTGSRPFALIGHYDSFEAAYALLHERRYRNLGEAFADCLTEVHPAFAWRGDVGVAEYPGAVLGGGVIVIGTDLIGKGEDGLVRLPRQQVIRTFRVE